MATIRGTAGNDTLLGTNQADSLFGEDGLDDLMGGAGADLLDGGAGEWDIARYQSSAAGVTVDLTTGVGLGGDAEGDTLIGIESLWGSDFADALTGHDATNILYGFSGDDVLRGLGGRDFLFGSDGADSLHGGDDDDDLSGGNGADTLDGGAGDFDSAWFGDETAGIAVDLAAGIAIGADGIADRLISIEAAVGGSGADSLLGNEGANFFSAGAGNDVLRGQGGQDLLYGSGGDDRIEGGAGFDVLEGGAGADSLDGGGDIDWARYLESTAGVTVDLATGTGSGGDAHGDRLVNIEWVDGSTFGDTLLGSARDENLGGQGGNDNLRGHGGEDHIDGDDGDDTLDGGDGNDALRGNAGADTLMGGAGDDYLVTEMDGDRRIDGGSGFDSLMVDARNTTSAISFSLDASLGSSTLPGGTVVSDVEAVEIYAGAGNDSLAGGGGTDSLNGFGGNDTLRGGAGDDHLYGGLGNDNLDGGAGKDLLTHEGRRSDYAITYGLDNTFTITDLRAGSPDGTDVVSGIEVISFLDDYDANGDPVYIWNEAPTLTSNGGGDTAALSVAENSTAVTLVQGTDPETGAALRYSIAGGADAARFVIDPGTGALRFASAPDHEAPDDANADRLYEVVVRASDGVLADSQALRISITDVADGSPIPVGTAGNDTLIGGALDDEIRGLAGNDTINGGQGADRLYGDAGNDTLIGAAGADLLDGGSGNDQLWGSAGADRINGGDGFDLAYYHAPHGEATGGVTVNLGSGRGSGSSAEGDELVNMEGVVGTAFGDLLTGNASINQLYGEAGNDRLVGNGGDDTVAGGAGDDVLLGGAGGDRIAGDAGFDTASYAEAGISWVVASLASGIANAGSHGYDRLESIEALEGSFHADFLTGNGGDNLLRGLTGRDTLAGGAGRDTFDYDAANHSQVGAQADRILDFARGIDKIDLSGIDAIASTAAVNEAFRFIGSAAFSGSAGQLRAVGNARTGTTDIFGDLNGDRVADFQIQLAGLHTLTGTDFFA